MPNMLANKEDAMSQDLMKFDFSDPNEVAKMMELAREKLRIMYANTPQILIMIGGNFLDMVERGFFKM